VSFHLPSLINSQEILNLKVVVEIKSEHGLLKCYIFIKFID